MHHCDSHAHQGLSRRHMLAMLSAAGVSGVGLRYALAQLPGEDRAVLRYAYYERRTTAQIASDLDISEEAVKSSLHGTLRTLWPLLRGS